LFLKHEHGLAMKDRSNLYAFFLFLGAVAVLGFAFKGFVAGLVADPHGVAIWFGLLVAAGVLTYVALRGGGAVTGTAVVNFAIVITFGGEVAAWLGAAEMLLLTMVVLRFSVPRSVFNASQMAISLGAAGLVYRAVGGVPLADAGGQVALSLGIVPPLVLCHLTYFLANTGMVAVWSALKQGRPVVAAWKASYLWMLPQSFAAPVVGFLLSYLYAAASIWLVAVFFLWLLYYARSSKTKVELQHSHRETVAALASIVDSSTPFLTGESERVGGLALELGKRMGIPGSQLRALECAALLHDVGYLAVGNRILSKGAALMPEEWAAVTRHAETGASIVGKMKGLRQASAIVRAHHERPDGRGYPLGLKGDEIPKAAAILKVADAFVAMTTERPYRRALSASEATERVRARAGSQYDKDVADTLVQMHRAGDLYHYAAEEVAKAA
jgi:HD-GYP domain-containing protein (c-di-GMP phosphodiesterase class II)